MCSITVVMYFILQRSEDLRLITVCYTFVVYACTIKDRGLTKSCFCLGESSLFLNFSLQSFILETNLNDPINLLISIDNWR